MVTIGLETPPESHLQTEQVVVWIQMLELPPCPGGDVGGGVAFESHYRKNAPSYALVHNLSELIGSPNWTWGSVWSAARARSEVHTLCSPFLRTSYTTVAELGISI